MHQDSTGLLSRSIKPCLRCLEIWHIDTIKYHHDFFFLPRFVPTQAAMFVNSLIVLPFLNSQFEQIYKLHE